MKTLERTLECKYKLIVATQIVFWAGLIILDFIVKM